MSEEEKTPLTADELEERMIELYARKHNLQKYQLDIQRMLGNISVIKYRENSGIRLTHEQIEIKDSLKPALKSALAGLKRDYQLTPARIYKQLQQYEDELYLLKKQLGEARRQEMEQAQQPDRQHQQQPDAADALEEVVLNRQRLKGLENRLSETGVQLLVQKGAQEQQHDGDRYEAAQKRYIERRRQGQSHDSHEK